MEPQDASLDVAHAAARLGITTEAVRKRIRRGRLRAYKLDGVWRVVLDNAVPPVGDNGHAGAHTNDQDGGHAGLVTHLEAEVRFLRELVEHQAGVIARLSERVPELPAGTTVPARAAPSTAEETAPMPPAAESPSATDPVRRSWWRALLRRLAGSA